MSTSNTNFDALMVDWLYGELDSAQVDRFEAHLKSNPEAMAEAMALRQIRLAAKGLQDAEPSQALTTILMREAGAHAPKPSGGLWASFVGFFQPLLFHPASLAIASFVLVVGIAGTLYIRNGESIVAKTSDTSAAAAPSDSFSEQPRLARGGSAPAIAPTSEVQSEERALEAQEKVVALADEAEFGRVGEMLDDDVQQEVSGKTPKRDKSMNKKALPKAAQVARENSYPRVGGLRSDLAASNAVTGAAAPATKGAVAATIEMEEKSWEEEALTRFRRAARSKRCKEAGRIANDLRERKPESYKSSIDGSKEESDCKFYIASETTRRKRARMAKAKRAAKKSGGSVPAKAKAGKQRNKTADAL